MGVLTLPASPRARVMAFLKEFEAAPNDADIDIHIGQMETGEAALVVVVDRNSHGFTTKEARMIADIAEESMRACADDPRSEEFPNLIMMLRMAADKSDRAVSSQNQTEGGR